MLGEPEAERAQKLLDTLFPEGLSFLTFDYDSQWAHSQMLLDRIKSEDLHDDLVELAGERFVTGVEELHAEFGEALGLDEQAEAEAEASRQPLGPLVAALSEAIGDYARTLSGSVRRHDPASCARFLAAVAPIDAFRAQNRRGGAAPQTDEEAEGEEALESPDEQLDFDSPLPELPNFDDS